VPIELSPSHLATFSQLTSIHIVRVSINPNGLHIIYSLPHLRSITWCVSQFLPTKILLPNHHVAHLRLFNTGSSFALYRVLRQVSGTLTAIEVYSNTCEAFLGWIMKSGTRPWWAHCGVRTVGRAPALTLLLQAHSPYGLELTTNHPFPDYLS
jgi:hypothetical protein